MSERTREPDREGRDRESRKVSSGSRTEEGRRASSGSRAGDGRKVSSGSRAGDGRKVSSGSRTEEGRKVSSGSRTEEGRKVSSGSRTADNRKASRGGRPAEESGSGVKKKPGGTGRAAEKDAFRKRTDGRERASGKTDADRDNGMTRREQERERRRQERMRRVRRQKIIMAVSAGVTVVALIVIAILYLSPARAALSLSRADRYAKNGDYDKALEAYEEALSINEKSVRAYRGAAGCLRMKEQIPEAEALLYMGWKKTEDEGILHYCHTLMLNEAVEEVNSGSCSQTAVNKCEQVLREDPGNEDAARILETCREKLAGQTQE